MKQESFESRLFNLSDIIGKITGATFVGPTFALSLRDYHASKELCKLLSKGSLYYIGSLPSITVDSDDMITPCINIERLVDSYESYFASEMLRLRLPLTLTNSFIYTYILVYKEVEFFRTLLHEGTFDDFNKFKLGLKRNMCSRSTYMCDVKHHYLRNSVSEIMPRLLDDLEKLNPKYLTYLD